MYTSLHRADVLVTTSSGPRAYQTDHRARAEIEAEPELSVLFALTRVLVPLHQMNAETGPVAGVTYVAFDEPAEFLVEALSAVGARLQLHPAGEERVLAGGGDAALIADRAFAGLARHVCVRLGGLDVIAAITRIESDLGSERVRRDGDDEARYWTTVVELMALIGEAIRGRVGGSWRPYHDSEVPFAFHVGEHQILIAANRAIRRVESGSADESMLVLLDVVDEVAARGANGPDGPLLPSLRERAEALANRNFWRPLLEGIVEGDDDPEMPVIIYGNDGERTFGMVRADTAEPPDHAAALANLAAQRVEIVAHEHDGMHLLTVSDSYFATEKLLDLGFMRELHARLAADMLAVAVPRRGLMMVMGLGSQLDFAATFHAMAAAEFAEGNRRISPRVILVQGGLPIGIAKMTARPAERKRGFFARLFGLR